MDGRNPAPLGNHGKPLFAGIYRGINIPGFFFGGVGFRPSTVGLSSLVDLARSWTQRCSTWIRTWRTSLRGPVLPAPISRSEWACRGCHTGWFEGKPAYVFLFFLLKTEAFLKSYHCEGCLSGPRLMRDWSMSPPLLTFSPNTKRFWTWSWSERR